MVTQAAHIWRHVPAGLQHRYTQGINILAWWYREFVCICRRSDPACKIWRKELLDPEADIRTVMNRNQSTGCQTRRHNRMSKNKQFLLCRCSGERRNRDLFVLMFRDGRRTLCIKERTTNKRRQRTLWRNEFLNLLGDFSFKFLNLLGLYNPSRNLPDCQVLPRSLETPRVNTRHVV